MAATLTEAEAARLAEDQAEIDDVGPCLPQTGDTAELTAVRLATWRTIAPATQQYYLRMLRDFATTSPFPDVLARAVQALSDLQTYDPVPPTGAQIRADADTRSLYVYRQVFPHGHITLKTQSDDFKCGLYAVIGSIRYQFDNLKAPSIHELMGQFKHHEVARSMRRINLDTVGQLSGDQISVALHQWGASQGRNLQLCYYAQGWPHPYVLCGTSIEHLPDVERVWIYNNNAESLKQGVGHWESMRASASPAEVAALLKSIEVPSAVDKSKELESDKTPAEPAAAIKVEDDEEFVPIDQIMPKETPLTPIEADDLPGKSVESPIYLSSSSLPSPLAGKSVLDNLNYHPFSEAIDIPESEGIALSGPRSEMLWRPIGTRLMGIPTTDPPEADAKKPAVFIDNAQHRQEEADLLSGGVVDELFADRTESRWNRLEARKQKQCPICLHWFPDDQQLEEHDCNPVADEDAIPCTHCGEKFLTAKESEDHQDVCPARPGKEVKCQCVQCLIWLLQAKRGDMGRHMNRDCPGYPKFELKRVREKCPTCGLMFENSKKREEHQMGPCPALNPEAGVFFEDIICHKCNVKFTTVAALRQHQDADHKGPEVKPFRCRVCPDRFKDNFAREKHETAIHTIKSLKNAPKASNPKLPVTRQLKRTFFKDLNVNVDKVIIDCYDCGTVLQDYEAWIAHKQVCPGLQCRLCGFKSSSTSARNAHEKGCQACPYCKRRFIGMMGVACVEQHLKVCQTRIEEPPTYLRFGQRLMSSMDEIVAEESWELSKSVVEEYPQFAHSHNVAARAKIVKFTLATLLDQTSEFVKRLPSTEQLMGPDYRPMEVVLPEHQKDFVVLRVSSSGHTPTVSSETMDRSANYHQRRIQQLEEGINELRRRVSSLQDAELEAMIEDSSNLVWLQNLAAHIPRLPWFFQRNRHVLDLRTQVTGGRGSVYPDDDQPGLFTRYEQEQRRLRDMRIHLGAREYSEVEAKHLIRKIPIPTGMPASVDEYNKLHIESTNKPLGPVLITVGRFSHGRPPWLVLRQLLANIQVARDFYIFHRGHANEIQPPSVFHSIWINGRSAAHEMATLDSWRVLPEIAMLVDIFQRADRQRPHPPIRVLVRAISGYTCAPRRWQRLIEAWPQLDIQFCFALRGRFVVMTQPQQVQLHGESPRGFWYTDWFSKETLNEADIVAGIPGFAQDAREINEWMEEELNARTDHGLPWNPDAVRVIVIRGGDRNEFD